MDASILDAVVAVMTWLCVGGLAWGAWLSIGQMLEGSRDQSADGR
jgi:hypothetical protein